MVKLSAHQVFLTYEGNGLKMHRGYASHVLYRVKHERFCLCQERSRDADKQTSRHAY
jgi:hypothetical protein